MATTAPEVKQHNVVSHSEWINARKAFLAKEKEFTHLRDELSRQRRELPWEKVEKEYVFDGPNGKQTLADLFGGRSQLIVYHFMLGPGWSEGCKSCSYLADHFDGMAIHLAHRDATLQVISRAPIAEIEAFKKRMGWRFRWVSSFNSGLQFRLSCVVHSGGARQRQGELQLRGDGVSERRRAGAERVFQGRERAGISYLLKLCTRARHLGGDV